MPSIQVDSVEVQHGSTALHGNFYFIRMSLNPLAACFLGNSECTALLLTCGASTKIRNRLGLTARQEANEKVFPLFAKWESCPAHVAITEFRSMFPSVYDQLH